MGYSSLDLLKNINQFNMTSAIIAVAVCAVVCIGYANSQACLAPSPLISSCNDTLICESGYFVILLDNNETKSVYCSAEELCGSTGWTRVGIADFRDRETPCPDGLIEHIDRNGEVRACKREGSPHSPNNVIIPTGISYSQVCGKILGYQFSTLDGFDYRRKRNRPDQRDIETAYFDGISVTYGPARSRQHIFSLAGVRRQNALECPCANDSVATTPSFVGGDYYCESGNHRDSGALNKYFYDDILWDGEQCDVGGEAPCCTPPLLPYFFKDLESSTAENIELRILTNDRPEKEDILLLSYEIYIK